MGPESWVLLFLTALLAGVRHGIDWDHIAAISDITGTQRRAAGGVFMSFLYGLGHASVVATLAVVLLLSGFKPPQGMERAAETLVGITLILLGIYVLRSVNGKDFRMLPRWALAANFVLDSCSAIRTRLFGSPRRHHDVLKNGYGRRVPFLVGMVHGLGMETPTQMMLFAMTISAGISASRGLGAALILVYSAGLVLTNTAMGVLGACGFSRLNRYAALASGAFSIALGILLIAA